MRIKISQRKNYIYTYFLLVLFSISLLSSNFIDWKFQLNTFNEYKQKEFDKIPKLSNTIINITTPENKTYTKPMRGYYPSTFGFEDEEDGDLPEDWNEYAPNPSDSMEIIPELDGHKKVVDVYKGDSYGSDHNLIQEFVKSQEYGEIEFWTRASTLSAAIAIMNSSDPIFGINLQGVSLSAPDVFGYHDNLGWHDTNKTANPNQWYHIKIQFECGMGNHYSLEQYNWRFFVDSEQFGDFYFINNKTSVNQFRIHQNWRYSFFHHYIDAVGYSWDLNYDIGDNNYEGLLLSYENSTNLNWIGYSLDGQVNKTILGNTVFPFPKNEGLHSIEVFGNDSLGTMYHSEIRSFETKSINIITPENKTFSEPMWGYYPGTFNFDDIPNGEQSPYWIGGVDGEIFDEIGNHKKVYGMIDTLGSTGGDVRHEWSTIQDHGTVESWMRFTRTDQGCAFYLRHDGTNLCTLSVNDNNFNHIDNTGSHSITGAPTPQINTWYHIRFDFRGSYGTTYQGLASQYSYMIYINEVAFGPFNFASNNDLNRFQVHTSIAADNIAIYWDAVGYSWDPNYNIGDNLNPGLLLSFDLGFTPDWLGYSLDGQANNTILGNTTISIPEEGHHKVQIFGNNSLGEIFQSSIRHFIIKYLPINIISPENGTYTEPMSGYYPATYGFESGAELNNWTIDEETGTFHVVSDLDGHKGVMEYDSTEGKVRVSQNFSVSKTEGIIEAWIRIEDLTDYLYFLIQEDWYNSVHFAMGYNGNFRYYDGSWHDIMSCEANRWYHIKIEFECSDDWHLWIDDVQQDPGGNGYNFRGTPYSMMQLFISAESYYTTCQVDAIGYSWDSNYNIGDNLHEGLLLKFLNRTNLNWIGYSLDGQNNKTIKGDSVISMNGNGIHKIKLFGKNSSGFTFEAPTRYFTINIPIPQILIYYPQNGNNFGYNSPDFSIYTSTPILDSTWYTLDNGVTRIKFNGLSGTIDQTEWDKFGDGSITIRFYVNDSFGQENFSEVTINKNLSPPTPQPVNFLIISIVLISIGIVSINILFVALISRRKRHIFISEKKQISTKVKTEKFETRSEINKYAKITQRSLNMCPFCQNELPSDSKFCIHCGSRLK